LAAKDMKITTGISLLCSLLVIAGCGGSYDVRGVEQGEGGTILVFAPGTAVREGETYRVIGAIGGEDLRGGAASHGRLRKILGRVRIEHMSRDGRAQVAILEGTVNVAVTVERLE